MYHVARAVLEHLSVYLCDNPLILQGAECFPICENWTQRYKAVKGLAPSELSSTTLGVLIVPSSQIISNGEPKDVIGSIFHFYVPSVTR